jgi:hypothetical protein
MTRDGDLQALLDAAINAFRRLAQDDESRRASPQPLARRALRASSQRISGRRKPPLQ